MSWAVCHVSCASHPFATSLAAPNEGGASGVLVGHPAGCYSQQRKFAYLHPLYSQGMFISTVPSSAVSVGTRVISRYGGVSKKSLRCVDRVSSVDVLRVQSRILCFPCDAWPYRVSVDPVRVRFGLDEKFSQARGEISKFRPCPDVTRPRPVTMWYQVFVVFNVTCPSAIATHAWTTIVDSLRLLEAP